MVLGFSLWDTISSSEVATIESGDEVCIQELDSEGVTIMAIVDDCAESVTFDLFSDAGDFSTNTDTNADFLLEDNEFIALSLIHI